jgi:hypothetical protein
MGGGITTDVQTAIDNKYDKTGGTINGDIYMNNPSASTALGTTQITLGNNIPEGTSGNSRGVIALFGNNDRYQCIVPATNLSNNYNLYMPNKSGIIATTDDVFARFFAIDENSTGYKGDGKYFKVDIYAHEIYLMSVGLSGGGGCHLHYPKIYLVYIHDLSNKIVHMKPIVDDSITGHDSEYNVSITWDSTENSYVLYRAAGNRLNIKKLANM